MRSFRHHALLLGCIALCACSAGEDPAPEETPPATAPAQRPADPGAQVETPPKAPRGSLGRVVVLGTSLTAGYGLPDPESQAWPALLEARAREEGLEVEVVNAGVSGDTSAGGLRRVDWILGEPTDLLIVELGANDGLRGLPVEAMRANLDSIATLARSLHPSIRIALVPMEAPPNLGPAYTEAFRAAFREVAERPEVTLLPFLLDGVAGIPELNQDDGIHPTPEGHRRMVENVWAELRPLLPSSDGSK